MSLAFSSRYKRFEPTTLQSVFNVPFPIFDDADVSVLVDELAHTDFSIAATYVDGVSNDAVVTLGSAVVGVSVEILGDREPSADTDYLPNSGTLAEDLALDMDKITATQQEQRRDLQDAVESSLSAKSASASEEAAATSATGAAASAISASSSATAASASQVAAAASATQAAASETAADASETAAAASATQAQASADAVPDLHLTSEWVAGTAGATLPTMIITKGFDAENDGGGAVWIQVGAEPSHPAKRQFTDGTNTEWYELGSEAIRPEMLGGKADSVDPRAYFGKSAYITARNALNGGAGPTDNRSIFDDCLEAMDTLGIPFRWHGHYYVSDYCQYPLGDLAAAYAQDAGPRVIGSGSRSTTIATGGRGAFHPVGVTYVAGGDVNQNWSPGSQQHGARFEGFTIVGPMTATQDFNGLLAVNARGLVITDVTGFGCPNGWPVTLYSKADGGMFRPVIEKGYSGHDIYILSSQTRTLDAMLYSGIRGYLRVAGQANVTGKVNDLTARDLLVYNAWEAAITTVPSAGGSSSNYGPGNILIDNLMAYSEAVRKYREGTVAAGASSVEAVFTTGDDYDEDEANDDFSPVSGVKFLLRVEINGVPEYREITADMPASGVHTMTIDSAFSQAISMGASARIMITTDDILAANTVGTFPRALDIFSNENWSPDAINAEEMEMPVMVWSDAKRGVMPTYRLKVSDGVHLGAPDGGPCTAPVVIHPGPDTVNLAGIQANGHLNGYINLGNDQGSANRAGESGTYTPFVLSGADVQSGDCVTFSLTLLDGRANEHAAVVRAAGNNVAGPMLVGGPAGTVYSAGDLIPVCNPGSVHFVNIPTDVAVSVRDHLGAASDGYWRVPGTGDLEINPLIALEDAAGTGDGTSTQRVQVRVRA